MYVSGSKSNHDFFYLQDKRKKRYVVGLFCFGNICTRSFLHLILAVAQIQSKLEVGKKEYVQCT